MSKRAQEIASVRSVREASHARASVHEVRTRTQACANMRNREHHDARISTSRLAFRIGASNAHHEAIEAVYKGSATLSHDVPRLNRAPISEVSQNEKSSALAAEVSQKLDNRLHSAATARFGPQMSTFPLPQHESFSVRNRTPPKVCSESTI